MGNLNQDKGIDVFDVVPFLRSFPFDEYELDLSVDGIDALEMGISPLLIDVLGSFGTEEQVKFYYNQDGAKIMISIHVDDILDIQEEANRIQVLNLHVKYLSEALRSNEIAKKVSAIKKSRKFIVSLDVEALVGVPFGEVIAALAENADAEVTDTLITMLAQLSSKKLSDLQAKPQQKKLILDYLDFQLHYAMIILGIVIAAKIH
jgi:hypothetical protein